MTALDFIYPLDALLMFAIALAWGAVLTRRYRLGWLLWWAGAATFFLSQVVHLPLLALVNKLAYRGAPPSGWQPSPAAFAGYALVIGLLAGVCEEGMRYAVLRWWVKEARTWKEALLFGAGHGGLEAILVGVVVLLNFFSLLAIRGQDLSLLVPPERLELARGQVQAFWGVDWWVPLLGAWERFFTLPVHVFLAVLVMRALTRRNPVYLLAALGWHTLVDAAAVLAVRTWGALPAEGLVTLFGMASLLGAFFLREAEPPSGEGHLREARPSEGRGVPLSPPEATPEALEATRYDT